MLVEGRHESLASPLARGRDPGPGQGRATGQRLETADVPAATDDGGIVDDLDVPDVAGRSLRAAVEAAVGDDAGADPGPDLDDDHVVVADRDPGPPLPEGEDVHVVVDPDRRVVARREPFPDRVAVPAGHDRRRDRPSRRELDWPGHADPDAPQAARQRTGGRAQLVEQLVDALEAGIGAGRDLCRLVVMAQDPAVEARDGDVDARRAEVGDEHVAGVRGEGQLAGRPAAGAWPGLALGDEPAVDQLADALGDDRPRQAGPDDELGARPRPAEPDLIEDRDQRVERLLGERAAFRPALPVRL